MQTPPAGSPPPNNAGTLSLTSREWVIPPRPKPGRKPATDTPPSKRKAQNRAAQRAFRERRAARVNELEDQIKQIEDDNDKEADSLRTQISHLEKEVEQYRSDLIQWVERCRRLETELNSLKTSRNPEHSHDPAGDTSVGCGKCTLESRCQCIDEAFDTLNAGGQGTAEKRSHSRSPGGSNKRIKAEPQESLEIDFTSMFTRPPVSRPEDTSPTSATVADPCGFCSDGTPCICAEMAAEQEAAHLATRPQPTHTQSASRLPRLSAFTPPPSEGDVSMTSSSLPPISTSSANPCANGPGTCAQCQADPNSTLFCKSLAASRSQSHAQAAGGCCGGRGADGGCCQSQPSSTDAVPLPPRSRKTRASARNAAAPTPTVQGSSSSTAPSATPSRTVTLTCADAYTTLSRHPAYERASAEITSWMPKLHASDSTGSSSPTGPGSDGSGKGGAGGAAGRSSRSSRPAMEIDAANVMAVLRDFDRRFGREG
jgi:TolA-binding protein